MRDRPSKGWNGRLGWSGRRGSDGHGMGLQLCSSSNGGANKGLNEKRAAMLCRELYKCKQLLLCLYNYFVVTVTMYILYHGEHSWQRLRKPTSLIIAVNVSLRGTGPIHISLPCNVNPLFPGCIKEYSLPFHSTEISVALWTGSLLR